MKIKKTFLFCLLTAFIFTTGVFNNISYGDSLWSSDTPSPYSPTKAYKPGDILSVYIVENTNAQHKAGTDTNIKDDMSLKFTHTLDRLTSLIQKDSEGKWQNSNKYTGTGTTQRASSVTAKIAAMVTEIMPNGNISIEGSHKIDINNETQDILISGIVSPKDINPGDIVYSYQIANANVSVKGEGVIQEAEEPGWFTRVLNWLF